jgi:hypothetical protein
MPAAYAKKNIKPKHALTNWRGPGVVAEAGYHSAGAAGTV